MPGHACRRALLPTRPQLLGSHNQQRMLARIARHQRQRGKLPFPTPRLRFIQGPRSAPLALASHPSQQQHALPPGPVRSFLVRWCAQVMARREPVAVILQRPRRAFNAPASLSDKDAAELWNSSQMECRPFKDPNFDLRRMEKDVSVQAVPPMADAGAQAGCTSWRPRATQCEPRQLDATAKAELCNRYGRTGAPLHAHSIPRVCGKAEGCVRARTRIGDVTCLAGAAARGWG
eukprot:366358-Chlamydomonas_euryale.AAC.7